MSRQINWDEPLSDADRAWALQFPLMHDLVRMNDETHAGQAEDLDGSDGPEDVPAYTDTSYWTKDRLAAEATKRELPIPGKAKRDDLVTLLEADDAAAEVDAV